MVELKAVHCDLKAVSAGTNAKKPKQSQTAFIGNMWACWWENRWRTVDWDKRINHTQTNNTILKYIHIYVRNIYYLNLTLVIYNVYKKTWKQSCYQTNEKKIENLMCICRVSIKGQLIFKQGIQHSCHWLHFWFMHISVASQQQSSSIGPQPGKPGEPVDGQTEINLSVLLIQVIAWLPCHFFQLCPVCANRPRKGNQ